MGTLSYTATMSLDGYVADANGSLDWSVPDAEVFQFHVDRMTAVSTEILGRTTYLLMKYWETEPEDGSWDAAEREFARRWQGIEHVVASSTLTEDDLGSASGSSSGSWRTRAARSRSSDRRRRLRRSAPGSSRTFGFSWFPPPWAAAFTRCPT